MFLKVQDLTLIDEKYVSFSFLNGRKIRRKWK